MSATYEQQGECKLKDGRIRRTSHLNQTLFIFFHRPDGFMKLQIENDVPRFTEAIFRHKVSMRPPWEIRCSLIRRFINKRSTCFEKFDINFLFKMGL